MAGPPGSFADQDGAAQAAVTLVRNRKQSADPLHRACRDKWNSQYSKYRGFRQLRAQLADARGVRDARRGVILDYKRKFGEPLSVPMAYATVETIVPRAIANSPRMTARPNTPDAIDAADPVAKALNRQQDEIGYELILQATARRGFIHGLGVQKTYWERDVREVQVNRPTRGLADRLRNPSGLVTEKQKYRLHEGPQAEDVDIFDFFWDRTAKNIKTAEWTIHRTWRSMEYIAKMVARGEATDGKEGWLPIDLEKVKGLGSDTDRDQVWSERMAAQGLPTSSSGTGRLHEVWEYHNRAEVITVLDNQLLVQRKPNPSFYGDLPFQIFRPTIVAGEFVGLGEIEPIREMLDELDQLRGNRLDNAMIVLQKPFFYLQGALNEENVVLGPGVGIPVNMDPKEAIMPWQIGDIPASGFQEASEIKSDIDRTTGVSDPVAGSDASNPASATATGIQLIQSAANVRIKLKTRNLIKETVAPAACQWLWLNRQYQLLDRTYRIDQPDGGYDFKKVTPKDWSADLEVVPDGDSTEPENLPQQRQDAMQFLNAVLAVPPGTVDLRKAAVWFIKEYGIPGAEGFLLPEQQAAPEGLTPEIVGQAVEASGATPEQQQAILAAIQQGLQQQQAPAPNGNGAQPVTQGA